jgi:carbonic anhydrase
MHAPSEHTKDGKTFPLELHVVHLDTKTSKPAAVIGILFEISEDPNYKNEFFDKIYCDKAP